jgi:hypothetical protein
VVKSVRLLGLLQGVKDMTDPALSIPPSPMPSFKEIENAWLAYSSLIDGRINPLCSFLSSGIARTLAHGDTSVLVMSEEAMSTFYIINESMSQGGSTLRAKIMCKYGLGSKAEHEQFWRFYNVGMSLIEEHDLVGWPAFYRNIESRYLALGRIMTADEMIEMYLRGVGLALTLGIAIDLSETLHVSMEMIGSEILVRNYPSLDQWPMDADTDFFGILTDHSPGHHRSKLIEGGIDGATETRRTCREMVYSIYGDEVAMGLEDEMSLERFIAAAEKAWQTSLT